MAREVRVPRLGWSMEEGTFVRWLKQDGDPVRVGEPLFELEGEKALQEVECLDEGVFRALPDAPAPGTVVAVGTLLGYVLSESEPPPWEAGPAPSNDPGCARKTSRVTEEPRGRRPVHQGPGPPASVVRPTSSPRARRVAEELGVAWKTLAGTGRNGRVREQDVRLAAANAPGVPISPRRRTIAERMLASLRQTAPVTLTTRADACALVALRARFKEGSQVSDVPSYTDVVAKMVAEVLGEHPLLGGRWRGDRIELPGGSGIHIGIAVDTAEGLVVPVIRDVGNRTIREVVGESRRLIDRARRGTLTASDLGDGVFTITNLGAFGVDAFTPIINVPETAILGLGAIRREPAFMDDGTVAAREFITLSLTFDHRVIDGAAAARFLQSLCQAMAKPSGALMTLS